MLTKEEMNRRRKKVVAHWGENEGKGRAITELARECNVTPETYRKYLREVGINPKGRVYTYRANRKFFGEIDNEEKAYWLGFLTADGNITIKEGSYYIMSVSVSERDEELLHKLLKSLESNHPIYTKESKSPNNSKIYKQKRLDISSKEICFDLIKHGCTPNKSLTVEMPNLEEPYMKHFLRGYFDGDGSIVFGERKYLSVQLATSDIFIKQMMEYFEAELGITHKKIYKPKNAKSDKWGTWKCVTGEAEKLLKYLYEDATIYLERKYQKYKEFVDYKSGNIGGS